MSKLYAKRPYDFMLLNLKKFFIVKEKRLVNNTKKPASAAKHYRNQIGRAIRHG